MTCCDRLPGNKAPYILQVRGGSISPSPSYRDGLVYFGLNRTTCYLVPGRGASQCVYIIIHIDDVYIFSNIVHDSRTLVKVDLFEKIHDYLSG